jgi:hypothetical protein
MGLSNREMRIALHSCVKELRQSLDLHCCQMADILEERTRERSHPQLITRCPKRSRTFELEEAIREAIVVLEESRKAFKSKKLEALRRKLTLVLINAG